MSKMKQKNQGKFLLWVEHFYNYAYVFKHTYIIYIYIYIYIYDINKEWNYFNFKFCLKFNLKGIIKIIYSIIISYFCFFLNALYYTLPRSRLSV